MVPGMLQINTIAARICGVEVGNATKYDIESCSELAEQLEGLIQPAVKLHRELQLGGDTAEQTLRSLLEHTLELTDVRISGTPRKTRAQIAVRLEALLDKVTDLMQVLANADDAELRTIADMLSTVGALREVDLQTSHENTSNQWIQEQVHLIVEMLGVLESHVARRWLEPELAPEPGPEPEPEPVLHEENSFSQADARVCDSPNEDVTALASNTLARRQEDISSTSTMTRTTDALYDDRMEWLHALREELKTYRIAKLITRATDAGVTAADIEAAEDAENHKSALIEMIVEIEQRGLAAANP